MPLFLISLASGAKRVGRSPHNGCSPCLNVTAERNLLISRPISARSEVTGGRYPTDPQRPRLGPGQRCWPKGRPRLGRVAGVPVALMRVAGRGVGAPAVLGEDERDRRRPSEADLTSAAGAASAAV